MMFSKYLAVIYIVFIMKSPECHQVRAFYMENYTDIIIGNYNILERHIECCLSESKCGKLCLYHPRCVSFFYNDQKQLCQLHHAVIPNSANLLPSPGSKYFIMSEGAIQCPSGEWYHFRGSCYWFSTSKTDWLSAKNTCTSMNAHLAIVSSEEENKFLSSLAKQTIGDRYWLDGTDAHAEGDWVWSTTGDRLTYTHWLDGEPNNANNDEHCLRSFTKWNDVPCSLSYAFICEMPVIT